MTQNTSKLYNNSSQAFDHLNSTVEALNSEAVEIQAKAEKNMRLVSKGIKILEVVTILTVTLNLVAVLALLVGRPLRQQKLYYLCIAFCWILTALFWMYFGLYYFLDMFAGDTCVALDESQLNHAGDDRHSVRHLTSSSNSEISEIDLAEMHAKKVRVRIEP